MNVKEEDDNDNDRKITSKNKPYIFLNYNESKNARIGSKFTFLILFLIIIIIIFLIKIKNNKQLKIVLSKKYINKEQNEIYFSEKLKTILPEDEILENEMMNKHTTFELGGPAKFFVKPKSINNIIKILQLCKEYFIDYFILGNGSNILVSDKGYDGVIIKIHEENFSDLKIEQIDNTNFKVTVGGGILMRTLAKRLCLLSLSGLEDIIDIPGTIGGGIIMNASAGLSKGLIYNSLDKVKVITPEGKIRVLNKKECQLGLRSSMLKDNKYMVIEATFNLIKENKIVIQRVMTDHTSKRYSKQPMYFPSAGCFFVWIKPKFGSLYEKYKESNLVSYRVGDAMIYTYNIAFIVNLGNAKSSDVYKIVTYVEKIMKDKYGLNIRREVVILGSF